MFAVAKGDLNHTVYNSYGLKIRTLEQEWGPFTVDSGVSGRVRVGMDMRGVDRSAPCLRDRDAEALVGAYWCLFGSYLGLWGSLRLEGSLLEGASNNPVTKRVQVRKYRGIRSQILYLHVCPRGPKYQNMMVFFPKGH